MARGTQGARAVKQDKAAAASLAARRKSSKFRGVSWHNRDKKWRAKIKVNGKEMMLGNFGTEDEAGHAYDCAVLTYRGTEDAEGLNFPLDQYSKAEGAGASTSAPAAGRRLLQWQTATSAAAEAAGGGQQAAADPAAQGPAACSAAPQRQQEAGAAAAAGSSRYRGVTWHTRDCVWRAKIKHQGLRTQIGTFVCEECAARAYDCSVLKYRGAAHAEELNFPLEQYTMVMKQAAGSGARAAATDAVWHVQQSAHSH